MTVQRFPDPVVAAAAEIFADVTALACFQIRSRLYLMLPVPVGAMVYRFYGRYMTVHAVPRCRFIIMAGTAILIILNDLKLFHPVFYKKALMTALAFKALLLRMIRMIEFI
jgi:hypothetical protein